MPRFGLDDDDSDVSVDEQAPKGTFGNQIEDADLWQDEELGMDDAAVVSDVEMEKETNDDELVMRDAEAAYASIFDTVKTYSDLPPKDEDMLAEVDSEDEEEDFDDGASLEESDTINRIPTSEEDYNWAAAMHGNTGICSKVANKVFANDKRSSSSIDFGKRMGRSFRVAWGPDGSFFKVGKTGTALHKFRPVFNDPATSDGPGTAYLQKHKSHCGKAATLVDDGSPRFLLPTTIGNDGDSASHEALYDTVSAYAESGEEMGKLAFSLLSCFVDNEESIEMKEGGDSRSRIQFVQRRKEAVIRFLSQACRKSVVADIQAAISRGDTHSAIFSALLGGDIAQACELAFDMGEEDLAACIGAFDAQGSNDIAEHAKKDSGKLQQIYRLLSGDVGAAGNLDWMRALLVRLVFEDPLNPNRSLGDGLQSFKKEFLGSPTSFPSPTYARGGTTNVQCILYRLLRLAEEPQNSITEVVDPIGVSRYHHDFALSFHLASCLSAAGFSGLSPSDEARLIDGYAAQLCSAGKWEWAVYVCLCSLNHDMIDSFPFNWKRDKARDLVLRHFHQEDVTADSKRRFLERDVGIPQEWIFEALAERQGKTGDTFAYIQNLSMFSPREASAAAEDLLIPNLLCLDKRSLDDSLNLMKCMHGQSPFSDAVLHLFEVSKEVNNLLSVSPEDAISNLPALAEELAGIESVLNARRAECEKLKDGIGLKFCPTRDTVPLSAMLFEALEQCVFLKLQMKAIEIGVPMTTSDMTKKRLTSLLAFETVDAYDGKWATTNVVRALR